MVQKGPHPTACTPKAWKLFEEDVEYQKAAGFCATILWDEFKQQADLGKLKVLGPYPYLKC